MKKLLTLLSALAVAISLSMPVFAEEPSQETSHEVAVVEAPAQEATPSGAPAQESAPKKKKKEHKKQKKHKSTKKQKKEKKKKKQEGQNQ